MFSILCNTVFVNSNMRSSRMIVVMDDTVVVALVVALVLVVMTVLGGISTYCT